MSWTIGDGFKFVQLSSKVFIIDVWKFSWVKWIRFEQEFSSVFFRFDYEGIIHKECDDEYLKFWRLS